MSRTHRLNKLKKTKQEYTLLASFGWNSQKLLIHKFSIPESQKEWQSTFVSPTHTGYSSGWELEFLTKLIHLEKQLPMRKLKLILHPKQIEGRSRRHTQLDFDTFFLPNSTRYPQ